MAKKQTIIAHGRRNRDEILSPKWRAPEPLTAKQRTRVLAMLTEGATLSEITTTRGIASHGSIYRSRAADPMFDAEVRQALTQNAEAAIAEAAEMSRSAADSGNPDAMRVAEAFHRCALTYAEKVAPKEYGQLVKLGSHDGGPLAVHVVSYAVLGADVGKPLQALEPSHAREAIDAGFAEVAAPQGQA